MQIEDPAIEQSRSVDLWDKLQCTLDKGNLLAAYEVYQALLQELTEEEEHNTKEYITDLLNQEPYASLKQKVDECRLVLEEVEVRKSMTMVPRVIQTYRTIISQPSRCNVSSRNRGHMPAVSLVSRPAIGRRRMVFSESKQLAPSRWTLSLW